jgi:tricorn protease
MMDGGYVTIPEGAMYDLNSQWVIENHGVEPDVTLEDLPADLQDGHDRQLETAVAMLLRQIGGAPGGLPKAPPLLPAYPADGNVPPPAK